MTFILNFHGIGTAKRPFEDGEEPYWITEERFIEILDLAQASGQPFAITFDDGNDSDYLIALPELKKRGLAAVFFVLAGKLDETGYLSRDQVADIDREELFTIGTHGMDHQPWPDVEAPELEREISTSNTILSEICGREIDQAGLPFGRYNREVMAKLKRTGHKTIYSSDGGPRLTGANPIPRFSVRQDTVLQMLADMMKTCQSISRRVKNETKSIIKSWR
jgi:peptidoglycan/xylan/chitin deacetylase (PgdA/CDA1 family)